jgi:hypothetical protein
MAIDIKAQDTRVKAQGTKRKAQAPNFKVPDKIQTSRI